MKKKYRTIAWLDNEDNIRLDCVGKHDDAGEWEAVKQWTDKLSNKHYDSMAEHHYILVEVEVDEKDI